MGSHIITLATLRKALIDGEARNLRKALGITGGEAARALGIHPSTLSRWERAAQRPRGQRAEAYAAVIGQWLDLAE